MSLQPKALRALSALVDRCDVRAINAEFDVDIEVVADELDTMADNYDPTPWCSGCGAMRRANCHCGPIAEND